MWGFYLVNTILGSQYDKMSHIIEGGPLWGWLGGTHGMSFPFRCKVVNGSISGHPGRHWGLEEYDQGVCGRFKVVPQPTLSRRSPWGDCCSQDPFTCPAPGENEALDITCRDQSATYFLSYLKALTLTTVTVVPRLSGVCMHNKTFNPPSVQWLFPWLPVKWRPGHHLTQSWWGNQTWAGFLPGFS